jgi:cellulose biosynthesis protein BcsQ
VAAVADLLLVPVIPAPLGLRAFEQYIAFCNDQLHSSSTVAPFLSLIDRRKPLHRNIEAKVRTDRRFLGASVPMSSAVERLGNEQIPTVIAAPRSLASTGYRRLWAEVRERVGLDEN